MDTRTVFRQHVDAEPTKTLANERVEKRIEQRLDPEQPRDAFEQQHAHAVATDRHDDHDGRQRQLEDDEEDDEQRDGDGGASIEALPVFRHQHHGRRRTA